MKKVVAIPYIISVEVEIEADGLSDDELIEKAASGISISTYAASSGSCDYMIGVTSDFGADSTSLDEGCGDYLEGEINLKAEVYPLDE